MPAPAPSPDETQEEYMDRCLADGNTESECQMRWDEGSQGRRSRSYRTTNLRHREALLSEEQDSLIAEFDGIIAKASRTPQDIDRLDAIEARVDAIHREKDLLATRREWERTEAKVVSTAEPEPRQSSGWESFGHQLQAIYQAGLTGGYVDPRLQYRAISGANEGVGADGGFLVGEDTTDELLRIIHETGILASRCQRRTISANSNRLRIRAINETSRANGSRLGGIQAFWEGEGDAITASRPRFRVIDLELRKLTGLFYATDELLQDHTALDQEVRGWFEEEFGFKLDDAIFRGTGGNQPVGMINADALVTVSKETGQAADTVVAENVEKIFARMWGRSVLNAEWFINQMLWPQLFQLSHVVGTGGVPMFVPPGALSNAPFGSLLGRPIQVLEQASALGDAGDIVFADLSQYVLAEKGGVQTATSIHVKFVEDETAFRFILRVDGQPRWNSALTPYQGSDTLSPFVTLAARA